MIRNDVEDINIRFDEERTQNEILQRAVFSDGHLIDARMSSQDSLLVDKFDTNVMMTGNSPEFEKNRSQFHNITFPTMLKLIHGSAVNTGTVENNVDNDNISAYNDVGSFPTISGVANTAAKETGDRLDEKQMIVYETICATFLLSLVNEGHDETTALGHYFTQALEKKQAQKKDEWRDDYSNLSDSDSSDGALSSIYNSSLTCSDSSDISMTSLFSTDDMSLSQSLSSFASEGEDNHSLSSTLSSELFSNDSIQQSVHSENTFSYYEDRSATLTSFSANTINDIHSSSCDMKEVVELLTALGGREQLVMFLTGPAGAGKTTAVKLAQRFCFEFCNAVSIMWNDRTFLFTAYTGSAASLFGGVTICKAAFLLKKNAALSQDEIDQWKDVRILVIDEISFMQDSEILKLDRRLKDCRNRNKVFGGYSIIFAGDFRQLEPSRASPSDLLFSRESSRHWENCLNAIIILENDHRFKKDAKYGRLLKRMWKGELTKRDRKWLNERVVGSRHLPSLPKTFENRDVCYACPYNKERNSVVAGNFRNHIIETHPAIESLHDPPSHTVIIEADIKSTNKTGSRNNIYRSIGGSLKHRIVTTCGDANCMTGNKKHVDPALCLYIGCYLICTVDNVHLTKKVPRGNGTLCRLVGMKLKEAAASYRWKNYYNRKVWTVGASDVEWIELEHYPKCENIMSIENAIQAEQSYLNKETLSHKKQRKCNRKLRVLTEKLRAETLRHRFRLESEEWNTVVNVKPHPLAVCEAEFRCKMNQFPVNCNDATTGHKLQGMSKDVIIITSWPNGGLFKNWEYVVLSRVRTRDGLYLFEPIDMTKSFKPSDELSLFFERAKKKEQTFLKQREKALCELQTKNE